MIQGRSLGDASRTFVDQLNALLRVTVTPIPLSLEVARDTGVANIRFRTGLGSAVATLATRYGGLGLYIGLLCDSVVDGGTHTLRVLAYRYAVIPEDQAEPQLRWEFVRQPAAGTRYARYHLQGPLPLRLADRDGRRPTLNDWHLPTG